MRLARDYLSFLRKALASLFDRRLLWPLVGLTVLLTATNIVILHNIPAPGGSVPPLFVAAAVARVGGLLVLTIAIFRILAGSSRSPWLPDGAFWLSCLAAILLFSLSAVTSRITGDRTDPLGAALAGILFTMILSPFAPWLVALAAERPLAWSPLPWMRRFGAWLGQVIIWAVLLLTPLAYVHIAIDSAAVEGRLDYFWPAMLFDGPLSAVIALIGFGLNYAAYRRVAQA